MRTTILIFSLFLLLPAAPAQEKKPEKKALPKVCVVAPLGVPAGTATKVTIRGLKLDTATEIRFADPRMGTKATAKILKQEMSPPPNKQNPAKVGDTLIEAE